MLGQVLGDHPGMKPIVVRETEAFIFRPGLQERARYYAIVFLNQLILSRNPAHGEEKRCVCGHPALLMLRASLTPPEPATQPESNRCAEDLHCDNGLLCILVGCGSLPRGLGTLFLQQHLARCRCRRQQARRAARQCVLVGVPADHEGPDRARR